MDAITLAIDAMGSDRGPRIVVHALQRALTDLPHAHFLVYGHEQELLPLLQDVKLDQHPRLTLHHTEQVICMDEKPGQALRLKPESSMKLAVDAVATQQAQACVSAGNTGALMAISYLTLKTIPGVLRPALVAQLPTEDKQPSLLLDLGANPKCDADTLFQFGVMGSVLAEEIYQIEAPKVALLNMGEEDIKGTDTVRQAAKLLAESQHIQFIGFIEGNELFSGKADVIVCDGFTGNIALKSCEGMARLVYKNILDGLKSNWFMRAIAWFLYKRLKKSWLWLNPDQYNGASLLGLRGVVLKSHGNASSDAFYHAIQEAYREASLHIPERIHHRVEEALILLEQTSYPPFTRQ